jgi:hypothetical protein
LNISKLFKISFLRLAVWLTGVLYLSTPVLATHIVGGEFGLRQIQGNSYQIQLTIYFDDINGNPGALDQSAKVYIFNKRTNALIDSSTLFRVPDNIYLEYSKPLCALSDLRTRLLTYRNTYIFSPALYRDPAGYYMVWERCCRNNSISNIVNPGATGQAFYMEFPAKFTPQGNPIVDNTPVIKPIAGDYACVFNDFTYDFSATDADGDSLVYDLVTPIWGNSSDQPGFIANLPPLPAPYKRVVWLPGFDSLNMIPGNPGLSINRNTGLLFMRPSALGLFVFAVRVQQYRNNIKIGEIRREFQVRIVDCLPNDPPNINLSAVQSQFGSIKADTLYVEARNNNCVDLKVTDPQAGQLINIRVLPVNFNNGVALFNGQRSSGGPNDTLNFRFCFESCNPAPPENPLVIDIIAADDGCSVPQSDTARLYVVIKPLSIRKPKVFFNNPDLANDTIRITVGENFNTVVTVFDSISNNPSLQTYLVAPNGDTLNLQTIGLNAITLLQGVQNRIVRFDGIIKCNPYLRLYLKFIQIAKSTLCDTSAYDTTILYLYLQPSPGSKPISLFEGSDAANIVNGVLYKQLFDLIDLRIKVSDYTQGFITAGFYITDTLGRLLTKPAALNYTPKNGFSELVLPLSWRTNCNDENKVYDLYFYAYTEPECLEQLYDTLKLRVFIQFSGEKPRLRINESLVAADLTERRYDRIDNFTFRVGVKSNISLELIAEDVDSNQFTLQARPQGFSFRAQQMSFTDLTGVSLLRSTFSWYPFCDQRNNSDGFDVLFTANEEHCGRNLTDSLLLKFIAVDSLFEDFIPPNLITVNGDGKNDTFTLINVMPDDNCDTKFEQIEIYSRWGRRVFQSNSRDFEWSPIQVPAGMYYYLVRLNTKSIKGWVQVTK